MSKLNIIVHPQAMLIISDHYSRLPYDKPDPPIKYHVGVLLGKYEGDKVVVLSALEVLIIDNDDKVKLDIPMYNREMDLHKSIYPNNKAIGWYILDKCSHEEHLAISDALSAANDFDNLLFGEFLPDDESHPFHLFIQKGTEFVPTEYSYETELAERIAMLQLQSQGKPESQIIFTENAFRSLDKDLSILQEYLEKVANKEVPFEPTIVRECANVAQWWNYNKEDSSDDEDDVDEESSAALLAGSLFETITLVLDLMKQTKH